jgi:hypothetical protein
VCVFVRACVCVLARACACVCDARADSVHAGADAHADSVRLRVLIARRLLEPTGVEGCLEGGEGGAGAALEAHGGLLAVVAHRLREAGEESVPKPQAGPHVLPPVRLLAARPIGSKALHHDRSDFAEVLLKLQQERSSSVVATRQRFIPDASRLRNFLRGPLSSNCYC